MSENRIDEKTLGLKSVCRSCGDPIIYTGRYWEHVGITPRHPAHPKETREEPDDAPEGEQGNGDHERPDPDYQV